MKTKIFRAELIQYIKVSRHFFVLGLTHTDMQLSKHDIAPVEASRKAGRHAVIGCLETHLVLRTPGGAGLASESLLTH